MTYYFYTLHRNFVKNPDFNLPSKHEKSRFIRKSPASEMCHQMQRRVVIMGISRQRVSAGIRMTVPDPALGANTRPHGNQSSVQGHVGGATDDYVFPFVDLMIDFCGKRRGESFSPGWGGIARLTLAEVGEKGKFGMLPLFSFQGRKGGN